MVNLVCNAGSSHGNPDIGVHSQATQCSRRHVLNIHNQSGSLQSVSLFRSTIIWYQQSSGADACSKGQLARHAADFCSHAAKGNYCSTHHHTLVCKGNHLCLRNIEKALLRADRHQNTSATNRGTAGGGEPLAIAHDLLPCSVKLMPMKGPDQGARLCIYAVAESLLWPEMLSKERKARNSKMVCTITATSTTVRILEDVLTHPNRCFVLLMCHQVKDFTVALALWLVTTRDCFCRSDSASLKISCDTGETKYDHGEHSSCSAICSGLSSWRPCCTVFRCSGDLAAAGGILSPRRAAAVATFPTAGTASATTPSRPVVTDIAHPCLWVAPC